VEEAGAAAVAEQQAVAEREAGRADAAEAEVAELRQQLAAVEEAGAAAVAEQQAVAEREAGRADAAEAEVAEAAKPEAEMKAAVTKKRTQPKRAGRAARRRGTGEPKS
ncbi:hypothetical protein ACFU9E_32880, partial [Kitasatospora sp. NPDC057595]